mgnify:CR=1 FL=1
MPVTTAAEAMEGALRASSLPGLLPPEVAPEFVMPDYGGRSLLNVPATVARILGAGPRRLAPPLEDAYWKPLREGVRRVVLVVLDALGYSRLQQAMAGPAGKLWARLARRGLLLPMTSVFPSTTSTALATLFTGAPPLAHGLVGYELWLREHGLLTDMLTLKPALGGKQETILDWGFVPERFLSAPPIASRLARAGIHTMALIPAPFIGSALTRMLYRDFDLLVGYRDVAEMWRRAAAIFGRDGSDPSLTVLYWGGIDATIHRHGSADRRWETQLGAVTDACESEFLAHLTPEQRRGTLLVLVADHGFVDSPADLAHDTERDPVLRERLLIPYSGEARAAYLHCRDGGAGDTRRAVQEALGENYVVLPTDLAVNAGLLGSGTPAPETPNRIGHLIVLARGAHYLDRLNRRAKLRGRHGGLTADEMLVPWLAARLDA